MIVLASLVLSGPACFTSTRHVRGIEAGPSGTVRIATTGGWLIVARDETVTKRTESDGLESHDLPGDRRAPSLMWQGKPLGLPPSAGTHVVGVVRERSGLVAALFGDRTLWRFDGKKWLVAGQLPAGVEDATVFKEVHGDWWLGSRRNGAWRYRAGVWKSLLPPGEPYDHNAQAMAEYRERLWVSTLEDGLLAYDGATWSKLDKSTLSTSAPRDLVPFRNALYVRHGDGQVDVFDGQAWKVNTLWLIVPRKQALRLATDGDRLYVGQWGGWSEFDGQRWTHRFPPELAGIAVTAIAGAGDVRWIGTQGRGLFRFGSKTQRFGYSENLRDDWITTLAVSNGRIVVGTFVGGAFELVNGAFRPIPHTGGSAVTGILAKGGAEWIATGNGVIFSGGGKPAAPSEAQCLGVFQGKLWVGSRRGIYPSGIDVSKRGLVIDPQSVNQSAG